ncbi:MAG: c-type cytochrome [Proteobacteria bacterium]|nr:c-type cytochrome [Pseudomonadota bacterium]
MSFLLIFAWAAAQDFTLLAGPPKNALKIHVVAKQWMWKFEHPGGQREINTMHIPVGRPVLLVLNSEDVIHSFFVPAFRAKKDLVPGLEETLAFTPSRTGTYELYCSEFCGTDHSRMRGRIIVMTATDYSRWLAARPPGDQLAQEGAGLFRSVGCSGCHSSGGASTVRAPLLDGLYGRPVALADGRIITADDAFIRDCMMDPKRNAPAGYAPVMPSFSGRLTEAQIIKLVAYVRSLSSTTEASQ